MPLNPSIPLQARGIDLSQLIAQRRSDERFDAQQDIRQQTIQDKQQTDFTKAVRRNEVETWIKTEQALKAGDLESAKRFGLQRKQFLDSGIQQGFQVRNGTQDTDEWLKLLETDPQQALSMSSRAVDSLRRIKQFGTQTDPRTSNIKDYEFSQQNPGFQTYMDAKGQGDRPSNVQEWEYYKQLAPEQQEQYMAMKRSNRLYDTGGGFSRVSPINQQVTPVLDKTLKPGERPSVRGEQEAAKQEAAAGVKKRFQEPKRVASLAGQAAKVKMLDGEIEKAKKMGNAWTTGLGGSSLSGIPGTASHDLSKKLDTIRANIGFDRLQEMRDNSPTGGALGQVSEMENRLLQSVWGNLEQSQSKKQFVENLEAVKKAVRGSWERVSAAYEQDYGKPYSGEQPFINAGQDGSEFDALWDK